MTAEAAPRAARTAATSRRPAPPRRPAAAAGPLSRRARGGLSFPAGFRWARVALLVVAVVVGLPLAHAVLGEVAALLGGAALLGFFLGRWTGPNRG